MDEKICKCTVCGKEMTPQDRFGQVRYRTVESRRAWESEWKNLCGKCFDHFQKWIDKKKGEDIYSS